MLFPCERRAASRRGVIRRRTGKEDGGKTKQRRGKNSEAGTIRFPTTALPAQVQRVFLSCADIGVAPLTRAAKVLQSAALGKTTSTGHKGRNNLRGFAKEIVAASVN